MIIKRLTLHNFGIYAADNTFEFKHLKTRSVSLIGGMNGRGKTTFLEAVLLALYGQNSFAVAESNFKSYGEYLRAHTNTADGTGIASVELGFLMSEGGKNDSYTVFRQWDSNGKHIKESVKVKKNNKDDEFLSQNWAMFAESILPSGLANFFFFDGEKIAEMAATDADSAMKNSIKTLLGINVTDTLQNDLKRVISKVDNEQTDDENASHIRELQADMDAKKEKYAALLGEINDIEARIAKTEKALSEKRGKFEAKGGKIEKTSQTMVEEKARLESQAEQIRAQYEELAAGILPLAMTRGLLNEIQARSRKEREARNMRLAVETINGLLKAYPGSKKEISKFIGFLNESKTEDDEEIFNLSEIACSRLSLLNDGEAEKAAEAYRALRAREDYISQRISEIDNCLSVETDKTEIRRIYKTICGLEKEKARLEALADAKKKDCAAARDEARKSETEFDRFVEASLKTMERGDDLKRIKAYALRAQIAAERFKRALQTAKSERLAETMTECCKALFGKRFFIDRIEMDARTLDYFYYDKNGSEIPKNSLSAGEKQLMVISMLWALAKCSGKDLPIIIDTPLARLDSVHRKALIGRYFPNASNQTIILSTDVEINAEYYGKMQRYVGNEFTLVYHDETQSSTVEEGYFRGVIG